MCCDIWLKYTKTKYFDSLELFIISDELSSMNPAGREPGITVILQRGQKSIYEIPHVLSHLSPAGVVVELYDDKSAGVRLQRCSLKPELKPNLPAEKLAKS